MIGIGIGVSAIMIMALIIVLFSYKKMDETEYFYLLQINGINNALYQNEITDYAMSYFGIKNILDMNRSTYNLRYNNEQIKDVKVYRCKRTKKSSEILESFTFIEGINQK